LIPTLVFSPLRSLPKYLFSSPSGRPPASAVPLSRVLCSSFKASRFRFFSVELFAAIHRYWRFPWYEYTAARDLPFFSPRAAFFFFDSTRQGSVFQLRSRFFPLTVDAFSILSQISPSLPVFLFAHSLFPSPPSLFLSGLLAFTNFPPLSLCAPKRIPMPAEAPFLSRGPVRLISYVVSSHFILHSSYIDPFRAFFAVFVSTPRSAQ